MKLASLYLISRLFTWACVSHNTGQHAISPLICVEIKLSVQFTKRQRLGIDGKLLHHKINQNKLKEPEPSAYLSFHVFLPFRSTRAHQVYPPTNKLAPVWKIAHRFPELSENDLNLATIIELGYCKISWFVNEEQCNYVIITIIDLLATDDKSIVFNLFYTPKSKVGTPYAETQISFLKTCW